MKSVSINNTPRTFLKDTNLLLDFLELDISKAPYQILPNPSFCLRAGLSYIQRIKKGDWFDPLLLQILPRADELRKKDGFETDPLEEKHAIAAPGVLRKYPTRVLLMACDFCAIHCRYCFRSKSDLFENLNDVSWDYLGENSEIEEVILSGGDPLCLGNLRLQEIFSRILDIDHIHTVRIHTRIPVANPSRIDNSLLDSLKNLDKYKRCIIVIHTNHAQELQGECSEVLGKMRGSNLLMLNQGVLLKGINDSAKSLRQLSTTLIEHGVLPYYIHQLDPVMGATHFQVSENTGKRIMDELRKSSAGYAVPRYVREIPGEPYKVPIK